MTAQALRDTPAYRDLLEVSERLGADPLQVQGPGGNTSLKSDTAMWVKASGTWLSDARKTDIMVPVDPAGMKAALLSGGAEAEDAKTFALAGAGSDLRPSIETAFHAAMDWPVVLHTHCVATIAVAMRADAERVVADRLSDLGAIFVPYIKPGVDLARSIIARLTSTTQVVVLGNHGLLVAGETPSAAESLLRQVSARLEPAAVRAPIHNEGVAAEFLKTFTSSLVGTGFMPVPSSATQQVALDPALLALADGNTLYPDHLIFLGPGVVVARPGETVPEASLRATWDGPPRKLVLVPGRGAAIPSEAGASVLALARALGDVLVRADLREPVTRLTTGEEHDLLNWDAEKHRQALEAARSGKA